MGFYLGDQKVKILKSTPHAIYFMGLGGFRGGCEEGVWVFWGVKNDNLLSWRSVVMVFCGSWGLRSYIKK